MTYLPRLTLAILALGMTPASAAERAPEYPYGVLDPRPYAYVVQPPAAEPRSGYIEQHQRGNVYSPNRSIDTGQPGAYRTRNGTVVTGAAQDPGCGGGMGQMDCPGAMYIPDDPNKPPCRMTGSGCWNEQR